MCQNQSLFESQNLFSVGCCSNLKESFCFLSPLLPCLGFSLSLSARQRDPSFDSKLERYDDESMYAVCTRLSGSRFLFDDWSRNFCLYCLHSLLCCFLPQRQGSLLIPFPGVPGSTEGSLKM